MLLSGVLFVLFLAGCWLYCLTDAALTPAAAFRHIPKAAWIGIIAATSIAGAVAWMLTRRSRRTSPWGTSDTRPQTPAEYDENVDWNTDWTAAASRARHPAGRSRNTTPGAWTPPRGPDDDPEFLRALDQRIRGNSADPGE